MEWLVPQSSARQQQVETSVGSRNGYGTPRRLAVSGGTIRVKCPRLRNCSERFVSRVLILLKRKSRVVNPLLLNSICMV